MPSRDGLVLKGTVIGLALALLLGAITFGVLSKPGKTADEAPPPPPPLSLFAAPSHVPAGESWVLVGSRDELPPDFSLAALPGAAILETQALSSACRAVRLAVDPLAAGKLIKGSSLARNSEVSLDVYRGQNVPALTEPSNFTQADLTNDTLLLSGKHFLYGYHPASDVTLGALRIHNRSNGVWRWHEFALDEARKLAEPAVEVGPGFADVDPHDTLPDTDGDGIYDFDEEPEAKPIIPEQLGIELEPGTNTLDIVAVDETGNASWKTLSVHTTYVPPEGES